MIKTGEITHDMIAAYSLATEEIGLKIIGTLFENHKDKVNKLRV